MSFVTWQKKEVVEVVKVVEGKEEQEEQEEQGWSHGHIPHRTLRRRQGMQA